MFRQLLLSTQPPNRPQEEGTTEARAFGWKRKGQEMEHVGVENGRQRKAPLLFPCTCLAGWLGWI